MSKTDVITLISETYEKDDDGNMIATTVSTDTFVNVFTVGAASFWAAAEHGIRADAEVQLRTSEYNNERLVNFRDTEYTVERVNDTGEFTRLTLQRRTENE